MTKFKTNWILLPMGILLFAYTFYRAYHLSLTFDEAVSFHNFHDEPLNALFATANSHFLNTILMWLFSSVFGNSELSLRFPNLLAHIVFMVYCVKLLKRFNNKWVLIIGFILINVNPFLLDFFGLARGYGLALSGMTVSLYYFLKAKENETDKRNQTLAFLFAGIAILANFILINYFVSLWIVFLVSEFSSGELRFGTILKWCRKRIGVIIISVVLTAILIPTLLALNSQKSFDFGGTHGFWKDTVGSLIESSFYFVKYPWFVADLIRCFIFAVILGAAVELFRSIRNKKLNRTSTLFLLLMISVLFSVSQSHFLKTPFPIERVALFFMLIFWILTLSLFAEVQERVVKFRFTIPALLSTLGVFSIFHFALSANLKYTKDWRYDAATKFIVEKLNEDYQNKDKELQVGIDWLFDPTIHYYKSIHGYSWLYTVSISSVPGTDENEVAATRSKVYDYYYVIKDSTYGDVFKKQKKNVLADYAFSESILYKTIAPQFKLFKQLDFEDKTQSDHITDEIHQSGKYSCKMTAADEYGAVMILKCGDLLDSGIHQLRVSVVFFAKPDSSALVLAVMRNGQNFKYYRVDFEKLNAVKLNQWNTAYIVADISPDLLPDDLVKIYVWHRSKKTIFLDDLKLEIKK